MAVALWLLLGAVLAAAGCRWPAAFCGAPSAAESGRRQPSVRVRAAHLLQFRGANSPAPGAVGETDCNSPAHWDGGRLYVFNSAGHPWRSAGSDLFHLEASYTRCEYDNKVNGGRWIECTWKADDGVLYGWYHNEPAGLCPGTSLTAPRIGAARSVDNGATWHDLGIILEASPKTLRCQTTNFYFAGGNGDFSALPDRKREYVYFLMSTYTGELSEQGMAVARMRYEDRDHPIGRVWKWHAGQWREPGLGGRVTAVFAARGSWHGAQVDAFWGPSIHWNSYLRQYVILLNRAIDRHWAQEGVYVSFNPDLAEPKHWSEPVRILESQGADRWYPQVLGIDASRRETDKLAGRRARLFLRGQSKWEIEFVKPGERSAW